MRADSVPKRTLEVQNPIGGVFLAYAYQSEPPFTTPSALNVMPYSVAEMRGRVGTRSQLAKAFSTQVGAGEVRLLQTVQWIASGALKSTLVASAAGVLRYSKDDGTLSNAVACSGLSDSAVISTTQLVHAVDLAQKLIIADWDPDATISAADRCPKVFTPSANTLAKITAAAGTVPKGCPAIARYRGRIVLAGARANPHLAYACRVDDYEDWDVAGADPNDETRPWAIGTDDAFTIGQPITALIATSDQCMIIGCTTSLWILRNDPASGGSMNNLSPKIGIVSHGAWCETPEGAIVFLSANGLYMTYGGCADHRPEELSRDKLPLALLNIGQSNKIVNMAFDMFNNGVRIFVSPVNQPYTTGTVSITLGVVTLTGGTWPTWAADARITVAGTIYTVASRQSGTQITLVDLTVTGISGATYSLVRGTTAAEHYFFDWKNRGFWPMSYDWKNETTAIHEWKNFAASGVYDTLYDAYIQANSTASNPTTTAHSLAANESMVLLGCRDGYLRWHRTTATSDDGNAVSSYIVFGPFGFGRGFYESSLDELLGTLATGSGSAGWQILAGSAPEEALNTPTRTYPPNEVGVWSAARWNLHVYPRVCASDFYVKIASISGSSFTLERIGLVVSERGYVRR